MLLTDNQINKWIEWFMETYKDSCAVTPEGKMDIPIIYSEDPDKTEEEHAEMWRNELRKLMGESYDKGYVHRGGRKDTLGEAQFQALWLYNGPIFKSITEKENETNTNGTTGLKKIGDLQGGEGEEQEAAGAEERKK